MSLRLMPIRSSKLKPRKTNENLTLMASHSWGSVAKYHYETSAAESFSHVALIDTAFHIVMTPHSQINRLSFVLGRGDRNATVDLSDLYC